MAKKKHKNLTEEQLREKVSKMILDGDLDVDFDDDGEVVFYTGYYDDNSGNDNCYTEEQPESDFDSDDDEEELDEEDDLEEEDDSD